MEIAAELKRLSDLRVDEKDRLSLLHEISVYQEELMVQNEELIRAKAALEETRDQFIELYDFAPVGYVTLDRNGVIRQCNLTAASFFGKSKTAIEGLPLLGFVTPHSRSRYAALLRRCRAGEGEVESELSFGPSTRERAMQLLCRPRKQRDDTDIFFISIIDITLRKELERERARRAAEHATLANRLMEALENERGRIARNLHDDIGQRLTAIRLHLENVVYLTQVSAPADFAPLQRMIAEMDNRLHFVATELRPAALDLGIATAIQHFVREWSTTVSIPAAVHVHGLEDANLAAEIETHLYRILQEALNNVAKHSGAKNVSVLLEWRNDEVALVVDDDGRGFDLKGRRDPRSLGLIGIRERAEMVGGRFEIESGPGKGTSVFVYLPHRSAQR
jgi:PAS domain S-box-containing protein